jgi:succinate dehydrogenase / fumarate reductase flavoprotein subunit
MVDLVLIEDRARGIITRDLISGELKRYAAHAVVLATGGYGNTFFLSTMAMGANVNAAWEAHKKGALFGNPCFVQIHPTCIPQHGDFQSKLTLMSESLRNDGRIWVPAKKEDADKIRSGEMKPTEIPEQDRDYYLERRYPAFGNLVPRDVASRAAKERCDTGHGVEKETGLAVYLDFADAIDRLGKDTIEAKYGNLFQMYEKITDDNPYETPMMIYPAIHYTMGGLWVDYELMTTIPGLFAIGECNFSDHGANRLGASALMQGLADGYFVLPYTIQNYLADQINVPRFKTDTPEFEEAHQKTREHFDRLMNIGGKRSADSFHKELGKIMWEYVGMARKKEGLEKAIGQLKELKSEFWKDLKIPGEQAELNQELEKANRVADFIEIGELMARDALHREESCGGHFREEYQTPEGEALRNDKDFTYVAAWEHKGDGKEHELHKEPLVFENIEVKQRDYKK